MTLIPAELPPLERTILQASALHYARVGRSKLMDTVRSTGARLPDGKAIAHQDLKPILEKLLDQGLLGSHDAFNKRYALPIERDQDHAVRERLRRLVRPFILRRLKSAVLEELPPRTEILLQVERSPEESTFYEALRRQIMEQLADESLPQEQRRFQVLAGITRLRRAACHPALVSPEAAIPSSKLELFLETVEELRQGRHKALVFSQFVDHLALVRAALEQRGITYQYLDGSTPAAARAKRVKAFQAGAGELFLKGRCEWSIQRGSWLFY